MLETLGVSAASEAVYRSLLAQPDCDVSEIAANLRMTKADVRLALDELADLTLLRPSETVPGRLHPVSPDVGLAALFRKTEAELQRQQRKVEATRAAIAIIAAEHQNGLDRVSVLRHEGIDAVRARRESLGASMTREVVSLNPNSAQTPDTEASHDLNRSILERGLSVRCVHQDSVRSHPWLLTVARRLTELGGRVRTAPVVPILLEIYDGEVALAPIDSEDTAAGALEVRTPGLVTTLQALFEHIWSHASPFSSKVVNRDGELRPLERQILQLLADGHTDEVVARKVGLSLRSVRRIVARLMDRLPARSRFQAGVLVANDGWL